MGRTGLRPKGPAAGLGSVNVEWKSLGPRGAGWGRAGCGALPVPLGLQSCLLLKCSMWLLFFFLKGKFESSLLSVWGFFFFFWL